MITHYVVDHSIRTHATSRIINYILVTEFNFTSITLNCKSTELGQNVQKATLMSLQVHGSHIYVRDPIMS